MGNAGSELPPVDLGRPMPGPIVAVVEESRHPDFAAGNVVVSWSGWQDYGSSDESDLMTINQEVAAPSTALGVLGHTGLTAWVGLTKIVWLKPGGTVVVTAAAGSVGSMQLGTIVAALFASPERFAGRVFEIVSDELTGAQLGEALSHARGQAITYLRFPDSVLEENAFLRRLAALIDDGRLAGRADIDALRQEFGGLTRFDAWLSGPGKPLLAHALQAANTPVSLR